MIYTTGLNLYSADSLAEQLETLGGTAPLIVLDTRSSRYSSNARFKNDFTQSRNPEVGYRWDPRLGGHPDFPHLYDDFGRIDYPTLIAQPFFSTAIDQLVAEHDSSGGNVLVVCACDDHSICHRTRAIGRALDERGIDVAELNGRPVRETLEQLGPDRDHSANSINARNRHAIPAYLDEGRQPKPITPERAAAASAAVAAKGASEQAATRTTWQERFAGRYAEAPKRNRAQDAILFATLGTTDALEALAKRTPSFIIDFRPNAGELAVFDATVIRPKMNDQQRTDLLRLTATLRDPSRPIAIIVDDHQRNDVAASIHGGGALLAGLETAVTVLDNAGEVHSYAEALKLATKRDGNFRSTPARAGAPPSPTHEAHPPQGNDTPAERDDDYAAIVRRAHEHPPADPRFADFLTYGLAGAAIVRDSRDPLGALLPNARRAFDLPAAKTTVRTASVEHAHRALMIPDLPEKQTEIIASRTSPRIAVPEPKNQAASEAREAATHNELALLDYAMRTSLAQDADARTLLLSTGDLPIVYASSHDAWWGAVNAGDHYQGYNVTGKMITAIRDDLRRDPNALARIDPPAVPQLALLGQPLEPYTGQRAPAAQVKDRHRSVLRDVKVYAGIGASGQRNEVTIPQNTLLEHRGWAKRLAALGYQLRSGGAEGLDTAHHLGVLDFLAERYGADWARNATARAHAAQLTDIWTPGKFHERTMQATGLPYHRFDETDSRTTWAVREALRIHPNPRALQKGDPRNTDPLDPARMGLRAHARDVIQVRGEDGQHDVEFLICWAPIDRDGLPTGGTRTAAAAARERNIVVLNSFDRAQAQQIDAYITAIERGTLRFGDGKDAEGRLYVAPRTGLNLVGQQMKELDPRTKPLDRANLAQANLTDNVLDDIDLTRSYAPRLVATGAVLDGTGRYLYAPLSDFSNAELRGDWTAATFTKATMHDAKLAGAFTGAHFDDAELARAQIHGDLRSASMRGADLTDARISSDRIEDLRGLDLRSAKVTGLDFPVAALERAVELGIKIDPEQLSVLEHAVAALTRA